MGAARASGEIRVDDRRLCLSNLDKVLFPGSGFTKANLIDYYVRISPAILPHLRDRPLTLKRYPDGVDAEFFYEKNCPGHRPEWVRTIEVHTSGRRGASKTVNYCSADDLPTLVWLANLAAVELHPLLARSEDLERPTVVVFDLDPGAPAGVLECATVAFWLRDTLEAVGLRCFPKSSGSKGLQVYVPLNTPHTYEQTRRFAQGVANLLVDQHPQDVVANMNKSLRHGKVFIDWSQNASFKTTVCVYSLRAVQRPMASTPLRWGELEAALAGKNPGALGFDADGVVKRVDEHGDLFSPVAELQQTLPFS